MDERKTCLDIMEEVVSVFCDEYCRFQRELVEEEALEAKCLSCPFNRLF